MMRAMLERRPTLPVALVFAAAALAGCSGGSTAATPAATVTVTVTAAPVPPDAVTVTAAPDVVEVPGPTVTVVRTEAAPAGGGGSGGAATASIPGDGTFLVGSDVTAGTYRSGTPTSGNCYWARLSNTDGTGETGGVLANNNSTGPSIATIRKTDKAFQTTGCETWTRIG